uniref:Coiled-coil and C2 domain-containing protein 1B n=1 Tax=Anser brachyrhynchus TaxID=132585 RepID=A0A8B9BRJ0_9AVES
MLGRRHKKSPQAKGQGAAVAKQLGLFVDFNPEEMLLGAEDGEDDGDLEAELAAITGARVKEGKAKPKGKTPLPMDHIEKLAADCMKDLNEDEEEAEDEDLEKDTDLLVCVTLLSRSFSVFIIDFVFWLPVEATTSLPAVTSELQQTIEKRIANYRTAISNAKESGESVKLRRYERGLKTLETMLAAVKRGKKINEEEMPPPVATGKSSSHISQATGAEQEISEDSVSVPPESRDASAADDDNTRAILLMRQKEYKIAALKAKQQGNLEKAKEYMKTGKKFDVVLEALDSGQPIDLQNMPPSPQDLAIMFLSLQKVRKSLKKASLVLKSESCSFSFSVLFQASLQQPKTMLEALQQRLEKYKSAAAQAKASGDDRKARMHERIAKQYQDAIRAHKAGRKVNFSELPVPPGFPPLPGVAATDGGSTIAAVLENASQLASLEENDEEEEVSPSLVHLVLEFLENRKKQYMKAAVKAKKENNLEQAKMYLRTAKSFDPKIEEAKCGKPVDISKLPSPPTDDEGDFIFIHHEDLRVSQKAEEVYAQLIKLLKDQHERCLQYSKQFMHLGNVAETTRFEKMAQGCKKDLDILQLAQAQGMDPPSHHFEERTFKMIRIFSELNSTEMHLLIVRGINLPAPPGVAPKDLDAFVKFEFHYPSTVKYNQLFKLNINRNHRGFRRAIRSKGIKFEVFHKGSFFRSDKQVGTAHLKLDKLESECEVREIIEIFDGRKPTGGKLEVKVRLREPLSGQDLQTITENWLVLEH